MSGLRLISARLISLVAAFLAAGCASAPPKARLPEPIGIRLPLHDFGATGTLTQRLTGSFRGKTRTLRFEVELTDDRLALVALTPLGLPVFALTYDGEKSTVKTYVKDVPVLLPDWILDDVLIANGPEAAVRAALESKHYELETGPDTRRIVDTQGRTIMRINYTGPGAAAWGRDLVLNDDNLHYRLVVTTLAETSQRREP
jgi:hypothetical protein